MFLSRWTETAAVLGLLTWDPAFFYQWPTFAILAIIYSALVATGEISKEGPLIFSKRNSRTLSEILGAHLLFLTILLVAWKVAFYLDPHLADWMTGYIGRGGSAFNMFFIVVMLVMSSLERRWLYVEAEE
jgi:hypothetical protein